MGRATLGVIAGLAVVCVLLFLTFAALLMVLGESKTFMPGTFETSVTFNAAALFLGFLACMAGGMACRLVSRARGPVIVLAVLLFAVFTGLSLVQYQFADTGVRSTLVGVYEGFARARYPAWFAMTLPLLAVMGSLAGGGVVSEDATRVVTIE